jgi:phosphate-selective porin O/P
MLNVSARVRWARAAGIITVLALVGWVPARAQDSVLAHLALPPTEIHGFIQTYYRSGDPTTTDGFRLRKADLKFNGEMSPHVRWRIGFDAAKALALALNTGDSIDAKAVTAVNADQRSRMLQDAAITWVQGKSFSADVGQQIIPLSLEGTIPTSAVETIERAMFIIERSRGTGLGDVRDVGASANGFTPIGIEYHGGVFNGTGDDVGTVDGNPQKAVAGRLAYHLRLIPEIQFGGSGAYESGIFAQRRERAGSELQYRDARFTLRAETMSARDGGLHRFGWYTLGAWRPNNVLQIVTRFDSWDRDLEHETGLTDGLERQLTVGASCQLDGSVAKFAVNLIRQTFPNVVSPPAATFVLIAFQSVF